MSDAQVPATDAVIAVIRSWGESDAAATVLRLPDGTEYPARQPLDERGNPAVAMATCGACGYEWNDALITSVTPTPAGRCPNEYGHGTD